MILNSWSSCLHFSVLGVEACLAFHVVLRNWTQVLMLALQSSSVTPIFPTVGTILYLKKKNQPTFLSTTKRSAISIITINDKEGSRIHFTKKMHITNNRKQSMKPGRWWHTPLILALWRQRQMDLCEFKAACSTQWIPGRVRVIQKKPCLKK